MINKIKTSRKKFKKINILRLEIISLEELIISLKKIGTIMIKNTVIIFIFVTCAFSRESSYSLCRVRRGFNCDFTPLIT